MKTLCLHSLLCRARAILLIALVLGATLFALFTVRAQAQTPAQSLAQTQAQTPIRLGTEAAFYPYTYVDKSGTLAGFDIDLGNALCTRARLSCTWVVNDWESLIDNLLTGRYDAILAGVSNTKTRRKRVAFSSGYEPGTASGIYMGRDSFIRRDTATIAVQSGTVHADHLRALGYTLQLHDTAGAALAAVVTGRADLVFGSPTFLEDPLAAPRHALVVLWREDVAAGPASIAFRKEDSALKAKFNAALEEMRADSSLQQLRLKWFGAKIEI